MTTNHFVNFRVPLVLYLSSPLGVATSEDSLSSGDDINLDWFVTIKLLLVEASLCSKLVLSLLMSIA